MRMTSSSSCQLFVVRCQRGSGTRGLLRLITANGTLQSCRRYRPRRVCPWRGPNGKGGTPRKDEGVRRPGSEAMSEKLHAIWLLTPDLWSVAAGDDAADGGAVLEEAAQL